MSNRNAPPILAAVIAAGLIGLTMILLFWMAVIWK